ncbi:putative signal transducing protein [Adhaeribacter soli]|uniref:DUF2007 domain-containing protein n=1 Tax=Adhaeribacter soli TaxID=2607655 RepID=A0A5N1J1U5_9BACT|nr:DUF2007 domain-containing protein [Adhaeribacter soli]KAA9340037.1 DUF2007 domain-containing protein [Adhaeribacter soli]
MQVELVTVAKFFSPTEAHVYRAKLESEGIPAFVFDENLATFYPFASSLTGGAKLKVRAEDLERAQEILAEGPRLASEE